MKKTIRTEIETAANTIIIEMEKVGTQRAITVTGWIKSLTMAMLEKLEAITDRDIETYGIKGSQDYISVYATRITDGLGDNERQIIKLISMKIQ